MMATAMATAPPSTNSMSGSSGQNQEPREQMINTAVKFLQNPRVQTTSLPQKQTFLRQKGLTEEEIDIACQKSGAYEKPDGVPELPPRPTSELVPFWVKAKDVANLVALLSIGSYSLYALWSRYIAPKLFRTPSRQEEKFQKLVQSITGLNESICELKELMHKLHTQQSQLQLTHLNNSSLSSSKSKEVEELKQELSSIKALLLSHNQFPPAPGIGIPSWQMVNKETGEDDSRDISPDRDSKESESKALAEREAGVVIHVAKRKSSSSGSRDSVAHHSDSSCEVVLMGGKNDSSDHSDD